MITLITAVPGSGKTLHAVELIDSFNKEGRAVYHNITGLKKDKFVKPELIYQAPTDWRDTPDGSVVMYDECQQPHLYPSTAKPGQVSDERLTSMEIHRKSGHDLFFITQSPTFVHHHVRKLVGKHIHFYRARGVNGAIKYEWSHTCDSPNDRREQQRADSVMWRFPKQFYSYYHSANVHTYKFKLPTKLKWLLIFFIPFMTFIIYRLMESPIINGYEESSHDLSKPSLSETIPTTINNKQTTDIPEDSPFKWADNPQVSSVMGCVATAHKCMCFGKNGAPIHLSYGACLSVKDNPLPIQLNVRREAQAQAHIGARSAPLD